MKEEEAIERIHDLIHTCDVGIAKHGEYDDLFLLDKQALETVLNLIETQKAEIERLEKQSKNLDKEAQAYLEQLAGDSGMKERTIALLQAEIEKKDKRISDLEFALMDMVLQFADEDKEQINTMGLGALEIAFTELDLSDPIDRKEVEKKYAELATKYYGLAEEEK